MFDHPLQIMNEDIWISERDSSDLFYPTSPSYLLQHARNVNTWWKKLDYVSSQIEAKEKLDKHNLDLSTLLGEYITNCIFCCFCSVRKGGIFIIAGMTNSLCGYSSCAGSICCLLQLQWSTRVVIRPSVSICSANWKGVLPWSTLVT